MSRELLNEISKYDEKNSSLKVNNKNSASPTIIIFDKNKKVSYKLWINNPANPKEKLYFDCIEYEAKVYQRKISNLKRKYGSKVPILGAYLDFFIPIQKFLDETLLCSPNEKYYFIACIVMYYRDPLSDNLKYDLPHVLDYVKRKGYTKSDLDIFATKGIHGIQTELIENCTTYYDLLERGLGLRELKPLFSQICLGIFLTYYTELQHNDLHPGNILVGDGNTKAYIFDWDRAYVKGYPNPRLNTNYCKDDCSYASCNTYFTEGYSIDLFRLLQGMAQLRGMDFYAFLTQIGVRDRGTVYRDIKDTLLKYPWFHDDRTGCNYLTDRKTSESGFLYLQIGGIDNVIANLNTDFAEGKGAPESYTFVKQFKGWYETRANVIRETETELKRYMFDLKEKYNIAKEKEAEKSSELKQLQNRLVEISQDEQEVKSLGLEQKKIADYFRAVNTNLPPYNTQGFIDSKNNFLKNYAKLKEYYEKKAQLKKTTEADIIKITQMLDMLTQIKRKIDQYGEIADFLLKYEIEKKNILEHINFTKHLMSVIEEYEKAGKNPVPLPTVRDLLLHPDSYDMMKNLASKILEEQKQEIQFGFGSETNTEKEWLNETGKTKKYSKVKSQFIKLGLTEDEVETSLTLLQKLVNIPSNKATYENLNKLRDVINTLTYGSEKNTVYRKPKDNTDKIKYRDSSAFM